MSGLKLCMVLLACMTLNQTVNAQRACGTDAYHQTLLEQDPKYVEKRQQIEEFTEQYIASGDYDRNANGVITIPVVFHVVYRTAAENVSDTRIMDQLEVLNEDFRRLNSDTSNTRPMFAGVAADLEIEFCLATTDPSGNPTTGITRTSTTKTSFSTDNSVKYTSQGGKDAWPASDYMNFWVCNLGSGLLGYAQFPGGPASTDGIVCLYTSLPGGSGAYGDGRTATHEVGHWLNLYHTFQGGCSGGDQVSDTPPLASPNYGCPTSAAGCTGESQFENYMDYVNDACMNMFTAGQKARVDAIFAGGGARVSLLTSEGCGTPAPPTCDDGIQNGSETGVDCGGPDCPECPPCENFSLKLTFDEYPEETSWQVKDASGSIVFSGGPYTGAAEGSILTENFCLPYGCYDFIITDSYGDGMCCTYGTGSYTLKDPDGNVVVTGGSFNYQDITDFCHEEDTGSEPTCAVPTNLDFIIATRRIGKATWDPVDGAAHYVLVGRKVPGRFKRYETEQTWQSFPLIRRAQRYEFKVKAVCENGASSAFSTPFTYEMGGRFSLISETSLYPNPALDQVNLTYQLDEPALVTYTITDMVGRTIAVDERMEDMGHIGWSYDVSQLEGGLYMLEISMEGDRQLHRFMVTR